MKRLHDTYGDEVVLIAAHSHMTQQLQDPMHDAEYARWVLINSPLRSLTANIRVTPISTLFLRLKKLQLQTFARLT